MAVPAAKVLGYCLGGLVCQYDSKDAVYIIINTTGSSISDWLVVEADPEGRFTDGIYGFHTGHTTLCNQDGGIPVNLV